MSALVDIQGFKIGSNTFILKEVAILSKGKVQVFLIRPPFHYYDLTSKEKQQVNWIQRNRKIYWDEGYIPYKYYKIILNVLLKDKSIYVKGSEKVLWMKNIIDSANVFNIEDKGCPSLLTLSEKYESVNVYTCMYHQSVCALKNVIYLEKWCLENKFFY